MAKSLRTVALVAFALLVLSQTPFIYRRYQLGAVQRKIDALSAQRVTRTPDHLKLYRGVIHVHTSLGGHSAGDFKELIEAAQHNALDFVLLTEHPSPLFDTAQKTLNGRHGGVLFVAGNEVNTKQGERFLILPGSPDAHLDTTQDTQQLLTREKANGKLVLVTEPEHLLGWEAEGFDGVEVYSLYTNGKKINRAALIFDFIWSFRLHSELMFARNFQRPHENLRRVDELTARGRRVTLFAGNDAHSNLGLRLGDRSGHDLLGIKLDPYASSFRLVRTYVWLDAAQELTEENLLRAIAAGRSYIGFDVLGEAGGFSFRAESGSESKLMGDEIGVQDGVKLTAHAPLKCRMVLFRNGEKVGEVADAHELVFQATMPGAYRVEAYLDALDFTDAPWIISNPIYVR